MSEFDYNNTNDGLNNDNTDDSLNHDPAGNDSLNDDAGWNKPGDDIDTAASEETGTSSYEPAAADTAPADGTYHYVGDPYREESGTASEDGRNPRYRYQGQHSSKRRK